MNVELRGSSILCPPPPITFVTLHFLGGEWVPSSDCLGNPNGSFPLPSTQPSGTRHKSQMVTGPFAKRSTAHTCAAVKPQESQPALHSKHHSPMVQ